MARESDHSSTSDSGSGAPPPRRATARLLAVPDATRATIRSRGSAARGRTTSRTAAITAPRSWQDAPSAPTRVTMSTERSATTVSARLCARARTPLELRSSARTASVTATGR